jgi:hypothetical protein
MIPRKLNLLILFKLDNDDTEIIFYCSFNIFHKKTIKSPRECRLCLPPFCRVFSAHVEPRQYQQQSLPFTQQSSSLFRIVPLAVKAAYWSNIFHINNNYSWTKSLLDLTLLWLARRIFHFLSSNVTEPVADCSGQYIRLALIGGNKRPVWLKVPSGQIGSKWEWYHWKALEKDINRYMFLIF